MTVALALALLAGTVACGQGTAGTEAARPAPPQVYHLLPDGSVPWFDEQADKQYPYGSPTVRTPARGSKPCRAEQLSGVLDRWWHPGTAGETTHGSGGAVGGSLFGWVAITNTSTSECTLQGEAPTELLAGGRSVPMLYTHTVSDEARKRVTAVPAGGGVSLRVDWSGPFCADIGGGLQLAISLPHDGGTLRAPVTTPEHPACSSGSELRPGAQGAFASGGFEPPRATTQPARSPMSGLTVAVTGPATAASGQRLRFQVELGNPTGQPIAFDPCPAYLVELFSQGDDTTRAVNEFRTYRLNCRPVGSVPAGGSVRFEMYAQVPAGMVAGRQLRVTWRLTLPDGSSDKQSGTLLPRIG